MNALLSLCENIRLCVVLNLMPHECWICGVFFAASPGRLIFISFLTCIQFLPISFSHSCPFSSIPHSLMDAVSSLYLSNLLFSPPLSHCCRSSSVQTFPKKLQWTFWNDAKDFISFVCFHFFLQQICSKLKQQGFAGSKDLQKYARHLRRGFICSCEYAHCRAATQDGFE